MLDDGKKKKPKPLKISPASVVTGPEPDADDRTFIFKIQIKKTVLVLNASSQDDFGGRADWIAALEGQKLPSVIRKEEEEAARKAAEEEAAAKVAAAAAAEAEAAEAAAAAEAAYREAVKGAKLIEEPTEGLSEAYERALDTDDVPALLSLLRADGISPDAVGQCGKTAMQCAAAAEDDRHWRLGYHH